MALNPVYNDLEAVDCRSAFLGASNYGLVVMDQGGGAGGGRYTQLHLTTTAPLLGLMNNANYTALLGCARLQMSMHGACISHTVQAVPRLVHARGAAGVRQTSVSHHNPVCLN